MTAPIMIGARVQVLDCVASQSNTASLSGGVPQHGDIAGARESGPRGEPALARSATPYNTGPAIWR